MPMQSCDDGLIFHVLFFAYFNDGNFLSSDMDFWEHQVAEKPRYCHASLAESD